MENKPVREVLCEDSVLWLKKKDSIGTTITSLPDMEELKMDEETWEKWFVETIHLILTKLNDNDYAIFYQTDRKISGKWIDKSYLVNKGAENTNAKLIFHKIVLKNDVGKINLYRPSFSHLLCFSKKGKSGKLTPDVIHAGKMIYKNSIGLEACRFACNFVKNTTDTIFDPFCGQGSILAIANNYGLNSIGIDIDQEQCRKAQELTV